ncbi:MAG: hypothetical protein EOM44_04080 [Bacteroidia bacterium]|nr:hypothetical protein [Bacteroidia bacterium]
MNIFFYKGKDNILEYNYEEQADNSKELKKIQGAFLKVLDNKNLSFLLGSGCSSYEILIEPEIQENDNSQENSTYEDMTQEEVADSTSIEVPEQQLQKKKVQIGIPVMTPMATEFYQSEKFKEKKKWLKNKLNIDVDKEIFEKNLEAFLSTLHSLSFYFSNTLDKEEKSNSIEIKYKSKPFAELMDFEKIEDIVLDARNFILQKCLNDKNSKPDENKVTKDLPLIELYKQFYRKLLARNSTLPRLNIFTTNYDLYSERAMDLLGIHYVNGFTGGISKFFNPAIFNYALAEKMDLSQSKWSVIDNFFYLYKLHGSVNWVQSSGENRLFKVSEIQEPTFEVLEKEDTIMIHPTPLKYNASLGSPYSDLFREFQKKLMQNNNILVTIGYSFSDEHINNLIFQAFTIPSFRLISRALKSSF